MTGIARKLTAVSIMALAASAANAAPAPTDWDYQLDLTWVTSETVFAPGTAYPGSTPGRNKNTSNVISWGSRSSAADDKKIGNAYNSPSDLRSSIIIDPTRAPVYSPIITNGDNVDANAFTHYNNAIDGSFDTLDRTQLQLNIVLTSLDGYEITWTKTFDVYFKETPNLTGNSRLDGDVFTIAWDGNYSETFIYEGYEYTFDYFNDNNRLNPLAQSECAKVNQANCIGFVTNESSKTNVSFSFNVSATAVPVPEPETYAMLLAGLGIVGAVARRRRNYIAAA